MNSNSTRNYDISLEIRFGLYSSLKLIIYLFGFIAVECGQCTLLDYTIFKMEKNIFIDVCGGSASVIDTCSGTVQANIDHWPTAKSDLRSSNAMVELYIHGLTHRS